MTEPRFRRRVDVLWRRSLDTVVLLPAGLPFGHGAGVEQPIALGGSGPAVWDHLVEAHTAEELVGALAAAYDADPTVLAPDVNVLLARLLEFGAIETVALEVEEGA